MKKLILFLSVVSIVALCNSCASKLDPENAKAIVMAGEEDNLPLLLQRLDDVENITLDSMKIRTLDEPMDGYLYTTWTVKKSQWNSRTWKYDKYTETKSIIIKVDSIRNSKDRKGYVEWQTGWAQAYMDARK